MRNILTKALAALTIGGAASVTAMSGAATAATPSPMIASAVYGPADGVVLEKAQYFSGGRNYCWYDGGWRGPGYYWCGYAWRRGYGWGGGYGWRGWGGGHPGGWYGHGGGWHEGGWHEGHDGWRDGHGGWRH